MSTPYGVPSRGQYGGPPCRKRNTEPIMQIPEEDGTFKSKIDSITTLSGNTILKYIGEVVFLNPPMVSSIIKPPEVDDFFNPIIMHVPECCKKMLDLHIGYCKDIDIVANDTAYKYTLETFSESRSVQYSVVKDESLHELVEHYSDTMANTMANAVSPPDGWKIIVEPDELYKEHYRVIMIPNTRKTVLCPNCTKDYREISKSCDLRAKLSEYCDLCHNEKKLDIEIELTVSYFNHQDTFLLNTSSLNDNDLIEIHSNSRSNDVIFEKEMKQLTTLPYAPTPDEAVNFMSNDLLSQHQFAFPAERIIFQRHKVEAIQVTELMEVDTTSRGQQYFVIGNEMSVFISREMRERKSSGRLSRNNNRETISSCAICTIL